MKPTLIIADDVEEMRLTLAKQLQGAFEILDIVQDGWGAIEACAKHRPTLLLIDLVMPGISGIDSVKRIQSEMSPAPLIVMMSGLEDPKWVKEAFEAGVIEFVRKDLPAEVLVNILLRTAGWVQTPA